VHGAQGSADVGVARRAEPGGGARVLGGELLAQDLHERDVEQPVEQRLLSRRLVEHLAAEQVHRRPQRAAGAGRRRKVAGSASSVERQRSPSKS
jgi:hypothetical protein